MIKITALPRKLSSLKLDSINTTPSFKIFWSLLFPSLPGVDCKESNTPNCYWPKSNLKIDKTSKKFVFLYL